MAPPTPTILALKQNFLTTQTRLLSQPVQPSRTWRRGNDAAADKKNGHDENDQKLSEKALDDALYRLNHTLQQHARRVYAPQATRHVAEQIDRLYLSVGDNRDESENGEGEDSWRIAGADYGEFSWFLFLPFPLECFFFSLELFFYTTCLFLGGSALNIHISSSGMRDGKN